MDQTNGTHQIKTRRNPTRQWLSIEVSAYILVCLSLVTVAWTNNHLSGPVVIGAWVVAGLMLTLAFRGIYRGRHRR
jgi:succinate dehydrogenase hydrophobic anchor subunit